MAEMKDMFANKAYGTVTETAANTLTFSEIQTNVSVMEKIAWVVHRIEWFLPNATIGLFAAGSDQLTVALTSSDQITDLGLDNPSVIDTLDFNLKEASAVARLWYEFPRTRDFGNLPGGGLIIAPRPLFIAAQGTNLGGAASAEARIFYTIRQLKADEYLELVDFYRIVQ